MICLKTNKESVTIEGFKSFVRNPKNYINVWQSYLNFIKNSDSCYLDFDQIFKRLSILIERDETDWFLDKQSLLELLKCFLESYNFKSDESLVKIIPSLTSFLRRCSGLKLDNQSYKPHNTIELMREVLDSDHFSNLVLTIFKKIFTESIDSKNILISFLKQFTLLFYFKEENNLINKSIVKIVKQLPNVISQSKDLDSRAKENLIFIYNQLFGQHNLTFIRQQTEACNFLDGLQVISISTSEQDFQKLVEMLSNKNSEQDRIGWVETIKDLSILKVLREAGLELGFNLNLNEGKKTILDSEIIDKEIYNLQVELSKIQALVELDSILKKIANIPLQKISVDLIQKIQKLVKIINLQKTTPNSPQINLASLESQADLAKRISELASKYNLSQFKLNSLKTKAKNLIEKLAFYQETATTGINLLDIPAKYETPEIYQMKKELEANTQEKLRSSVLETKQESLDRFLLQKLTEIVGYKVVNVPENLQKPILNTVLYIEKVKSLTTKDLDNKSKEFLLTTFNSYIKEFLENSGEIDLTQINPNLDKVFKGRIKNGNIPHEFKEKYEEIKQKLEKGEFVRDDGEILNLDNVTVEDLVKEFFPEFEVEKWKEPYFKKGSEYNFEISCNPILDLAKMNISTLEFSCQKLSEFLFDSAMANVSNFSSNLLTIKDKEGNLVGRMWLLLSPHYGLIRLPVFHFSEDMGYKDGLEDFSKDYASYLGVTLCDSNLKIQPSKEVIHSSYPCYFDLEQYQAT